MPRVVMAGAPIVIVEFFIPLTEYVVIEDGVVASCSCVSGHGGFLSALARSRVLEWFEVRVWTARCDIHNP